MSALPVRSVVMTVVLVAAAVVMAVLATNSVDLMIKIGKARELRGRDAPVAGAVAGWTALDASEWIPDPDAREGGILFGISELAGTGSLGYWEDMTRRLQMIRPSVKIVGLCLRVDACSAAKADKGLTLLEAMDPVFVHNLAVASEGERILLFRGSRVTGSLSISGDIEQLLRQIVMQFPRRDSGSGA